MHLQIRSPAAGTAHGAFGFDLLGGSIETNNTATLLRAQAFYIARRMRVTPILARIIAELAFRRAA